MRNATALRRLHKISVCYENIQLAATYMSTQNWGHPAQRVARPSLPREGLACETKSVRRSVLPPPVREYYAKMRANG